jgi:GNT-I family
LQPAVVWTISSARPEYLIQALDSWADARGAGEADFVFCCEPGGPASASWASQFAYASSVDVVQHSSQLGPVANTRFALEQGFALSDFVVCTEEDVVVADDVLEYFGWAAAEYAADRKVAGVCAFVSDAGEEPGEVFRYPFFSPLAWGTWRNRWEEEIGPDWGGLNVNPRAWDRRMQLHQCLKRGHDFIFPQCSRSQHIGREGLHSASYPGWFEETVSVNFREHYEPAAFREVEAQYGMPPGGTPPLAFIGAAGLAGPPVA